MKILKFYFIYLILGLICYSCANNSKPLNVPLKYEAYDDNWLERFYWYRIQGVDTILYAGSFVLQHKGNFQYNGCYCQKSGKWEQRSDSLFLFYSNIAGETSTIDTTIDCSKFVDQVYLIKKEGELLEKIYDNKDLLELYGILEN